VQRCTTRSLDFPTPFQHLPLDGCCTTSYNTRMTTATATDQGFAVQGENKSLSLLSGVDRPNVSIQRSGTCAGWLVSVDQRRLTVSFSLMDADAIRLAEHILEHTERGS
jgi:hypothetical protein